MAKSKLPKELTTVTPLSKFLAGALFVFLPIVAFIMGMNYQKQITADLTYKMQEANSSASLVVPTQAMMKTEIPADWKTFTNKAYNVEFKHPADLPPKLTTANKMLTVTMKNASNDMKLEVKAATGDAKMMSDKWEMSKEGETTMYTMMKNEMAYTFSVMKSESKEVVDQILASFNVTEEKMEKEATDGAMKAN
jgi:hypothetical protein